VVLEPSITKFVDTNDLHFDKQTFLKQHIRRSSTLYDQLRTRAFVETMTSVAVQNGSKKDDIVTTYRFTFPDKKEEGPITINFKNVMRNALIKTQQFVQQPKNKKRKRVIHEDEEEEDDKV
jgi:hypothetical protein